MRMENNTEDDERRIRNDGFESELAGESKQLLSMENQKFYKNNLSDGGYTAYVNHSE